MSNDRQWYTHPIVFLFLLAGIGWLAWSYIPRETKPKDAQVGDEVLRILLVGNSYTKGNDLRGMLAKLAEAAEKEVYVGEQVVLGSQLSEHLKDFEISQAKWDFVVLQEQSLIPAVEKLRKEKMIPVATKFKTLIQERGGKPILFATWARKDGLAQFNPDMKDYASMQAMINEGFQSAAEELSMELAPVGKAWEKVMQDRPNLDLYIADGSHPSKYGSYLAACVIYATIFDESPLSLPYYNGIDLEVAEYFQSVAAEATSTLHNDRPESSSNE